MYRATLEVVEERNVYIDDDILGHVVDCFLDPSCTRGRKTLYLCTVKLHFHLKMIIGKALVEERDNNNKISLQPNIS